MKRFLTIFFSSLLMSFSLVFSGCSIDNYTLISDDFKLILEYGEEIDFSSLSIVKNAGQEDQEDILVTPDMIVSYGDTQTVGQKQLEIVYQDQTFTIDYWVKYKVDFYVDEALYDSQYILSNQDIVMPDNPVLEGYDFVEWSNTLTEEVTDNVRVEALFTIEGTGIPKLTTKNATYGDTLADIELPSNSKGSWVFINNLQTEVGDAGEKTFPVKFVPRDPKLLTVEYADVKVKVAKKQLAFTNVNRVFDYDGSAKLPSYMLPVEGLKVNYNPLYRGDAVDAGSYEFYLEIEDKNYCGEYPSGSASSSLIINPITTVINVEGAIITFGDKVPTEYAYTIKDLQGNDLKQSLVDIMGFKIVAPTYTHAGDDCPIRVVVENKNFRPTIYAGSVVVQKATYDISDSIPAFAGGDDITYGEKLSSLTIVENDSRGRWVWTNPETTVLTPTQVTANVTFIPKEELDYNRSSKDITLNVNKRVLTISVINNEYVYDKSSHSIQYSVSGYVGGDSESIVVGNEVKQNAGSYPITLKISDEDLKYTGSLSTTLKIAKANSASFAKQYEKTWTTELTLNDIALDENFTWVEPTKRVNDVGVQQFEVVYTPKDQANYNIENGLISVDIKKATAAVVAEKNYSFEYNPTGYTLTNIVPSHGEATVTFEYKLNDKNVDKISSVGTYEVTITLAESAHYNRASTTTTVSVTPGLNKDTFPAKINATYGETLSKYLKDLPKNNNGTWEWKEDSSTKVGNAGSSRVHIATFVPEENYAGREVEVLFDIAKKTVEVPTIEAKPYDIKLQTADVADTAEYTVVENNGGTYFGDYDVVLSLRDENNYIWDNGDESKQITLTFKITKNTINNWNPEKSPKIIHSLVYNGASVSYEAEATYGSVSVTFKDATTQQSVETPKNAGSYIATFTVEETLSYLGLEREIAFTISPAPVTAPTSVADIEYCGSEINADISDGEGYVVTENEKHINTGSYTVTLALVSSNYIWSDNTTADKELGYKITKYKDNDWKEGQEPSMSSWEYGQPRDGVTGIAIAQFGTTIVMYKEKDADSKTYSLTLPTEAGKYIALFKVEDTVNYNKVESEVSFTISQATPTLTAPTYDMTLVYYENNIDVSKIYKTGARASVEGTITYNAPVMQATTVTAGKTYEQVAFTISFVPTDSRNYKSVSTQANINLYKVAHIGTTYYGSIENALLNATSGSTVTVIPDKTGNTVIRNPITIDNGVTLTLPYLTATGAEAVNSSGMATLYTNSSTGPLDYVAGLRNLTLTSKVVVEKDVTITNNGTITIAGEISGGGPTGAKINDEPIGFEPTIAGNTARFYAKLVLKPGAKIISNGTINCFGIIDEDPASIEEEKANLVEGQEIKKAQIIAETGTVYMPFVVNDFRGGNYMLAAMGGLLGLRKKVSPFNQFELRNIVPELTIQNSASLVGHANLYAGGQQNHTEIKLVGKANGNLVQFTTDQSYLVAKYNINDRSLEHDRWERGVCNLQFFGGAKTNTLSMKVQLSSSISKTIDTSQAPFPITWRHNITLNDGAYTLNNTFKFMPGSVFTVSSTATLTANNITIYESFVDTLNKEDGNLPKEAVYGYDMETLPPAVFNVEKSMTVTNIGGKVYSNTIGATVKILKNTKSNTYEAQDGKKESLYEITTYETFGNSFSLCYGTSSKSITSKGTYTLTATGWQ